MRINSLIVRATLVATAATFGLSSALAQETKPAAPKPDAPKITVIDKSIQPATPIAKPALQPPAQPAQPNGAAPQQVQPAATLPNALKFSKPSHDWGDISDTAPAETDVEFTNISDKTITIAAAASCGCTVAQLEKPTLAPGETTKAHAKFDPHGKTGNQTKTLTFTVTNPQGAFAQQTFNLSANIKALVTFDPPKLFANEVDHRTGKQERITVTGRKPGFQVTKVESTNEYITATIGESKEVDVAGEKLTQVVLNLELGKNAPIGNLTTQLTVSTNEEKAQLNPLYVGADVVGDVKVTPAQAIIRVNTTSTPFKDIDVRVDSRSGTKFKITGVDIENTRKDFSVVPDIKEGPEGKFYMVSLSGMTPSEPGMHTGYLVISTDAGGEKGETLRVPFSVAVAKPATAAMNPVPAPGAVKINPTPTSAPEVVPVKK